MIEVKAEIIARIDEDTWLRSRLNGGFDLSGGIEPKYDNQVKAVLRAAEGFLDLTLTENHCPDKKNKFVDASINFRARNAHLVIRVDNKIPSRVFHYNVKENGKTVENHTPIAYDPLQPSLNFSLNKVMEYFGMRYAGLRSKWVIFDQPPLQFLGAMLSFNRVIKGGIPLPIALIAYPGSNVKMDIYSRKSQYLDLVPLGFVIEKP